MSISKSLFCFESSIFIIPGFKLWVIDFGVLDAERPSSLNLCKVSFIFPAELFVPSKNYLSFFRVFVACSPNPCLSSGRCAVIGESPKLYGFSNSSLKSKLFGVGLEIFNVYFGPSLPTFKFSSLWNCSLLFWKFMSYNVAFKLFSALTHYCKLINRDGSRGLVDFWAF